MVVLLSPSFLIGLSQSCLGLVLFAVSIAKRISPAKQRKNLPMIARSPLSFLIAFMLFVSGIILVTNGWQLSPTLQFQQFLMTCVIAIDIISSMIKQKY